MSREFGTELTSGDVRYESAFRGLSGPDADIGESLLMTHLCHCAPKFAVVHNMVLML
jgi:hypothetical protein